MRRGKPLIALVFALGAITTTPAAAQAPDARPQIISAGWISGTVTARTLEVVEIRAIDRDGVVTTLNVAWGDGGLAHADLICHEQGEVAEVRLTHVFRDPGIYSVKIAVGSGPKCFTVQQLSPVEEIRTVVFR